MSSSASEQSEGGVPLMPSPMPITPAQHGNQHVNQHGNQHAHQHGTQPTNMVPSASGNNTQLIPLQTGGGNYAYTGPRVPPFVFPPPQQSFARSDFMTSTVSSPDYAGQNTPSVGYNSTVLETIPAGTVPQPNCPSAGHGYYSLEGTNHAMEKLTRAIGDLNVKAHPDQQAAQFHARLSHQRIQGLIHAVDRQRSLPTQFAEQLNFDLKEALKSIARVNAAVENVSSLLDQKTVDHDRVQATAGLQAVEIERLRHDIDTARRETQSVEKTNEEVQKTYQDVLRSMEEQARLDQEKIKAYEEQLNSQRQMLFTANRDAREKASTVDTFRGNIGANPLGRPSMPTSRANTPTTDLTLVSRPPRIPSPGGHLAVPARPPSAFPSVGGPRFACAKPRSTSALRNSYQGLGNTQYKFDEPRSSRQISNGQGSPVPARPRQVFIAKPSSEMEHVVMQWRENFSKVFSMVHGWCSTYASEGKTEEAAMVQTRAPKLWEFMTDILYPGRPESGAAHAKHLLREPTARVYFVQRILLQYIVNNIFAVDGWFDFRVDVDAKLKGLSERLENTELYKVYERQSIVDQIAVVINTILMDSEFPAFRQRKENFHHQRLKTIAGPLMDMSASRSDAGYDLHNIAATALQTSANIFQSRLNLQFAWNTTCSKFSVEAHTAKETTIDPVTLQMKQWRLKLVITPSITIRDDRGLSSAPTRVLRSEVLVMN